MLISSIVWAYFLLTATADGVEAEDGKEVGASADELIWNARFEDSKNESGNASSSGGGRPPPCIDQFSTSYCTTRLFRRGKQYCRKDHYFGRMQCCGTCLRAWNESGNFTSGSSNATAWFIPCEDFVNPDGTSMTSWCQEFAAPARNHPIFSCSKSRFVKNRCMKTCGFC